MSFETEVNLMMALSDAMADGVEKAGASTVLVSARPRIPSSGVAVAADLVLTSNHAVEQTQGIQVLLPDGSQVQASLVGRDSPTDLALLRLEKPRAVPAERATGEPRVGQLVLAVARPSEEGLQASQGVISFVGGPFRTQSGILLQRFLRSDAIPYPGFSGGPLIDSQGRVLGINSSGYVQGVSITLPAAAAWEVADQIRLHGQVRRGYLGIRSQPVELPADLRSALGRSQAQGLMLVHVENDSPASRGGLWVGDILIGVGADPLENHDQLLSALAHTAGQDLAFDLIRGGKRQRVSVQIGEIRAKEAAMVAEVVPMLVSEAFDTQAAHLIERVQRAVIQVHNGRRGVGAGLIWRQDGLVVTNDHVVADGQGRLTVVLGQGMHYRAQLLARGPQVDLAVLRIETSGLPVVSIANSHGLRVGQLVFAVGHPWGQVEYLTAGIISALGSFKTQSGRIVPFIRSDAALAPGNSGGPLVNAAGGVIGINNMIVGGDQGIAIPSHVVAGFVEETLHNLGSNSPGALVFN